MKPHIEMAHHYWKEILREGDVVIDATCGNGHDTYFLAQTLGGRGTIYALDIQKGALKETERRLSSLPEKIRESVILTLASHQSFPQKKTALIVYNLGYLPGGDKEKTTKMETTLLSVKNALEIAEALSITCYPGHPEGAREEEALLALLSNLPPDIWKICYHQWINKKRGPSLIWLQRCAPLP